MADEKRRLIDTFNLLSEAYDESPLRFFDLNAAGLVREAQIPEGARVLDVATGTGKVALAAARAAGPGGRVAGIDLSNGMLAQARRKIGVLPVTFAQMDAEKLAFNDGTFDVILCGFGVFFFLIWCVGCARCTAPCARVAGSHSRRGPKRRFNR